MKFKGLFKDIVFSGKRQKTVYLTGDLDLSLSSVLSVAFGNPEVRFKLTPKRKETIKNVLRAMNDQIRSGTPMYGTTTSYGGRAGVVLNHGDEKKRFENAVLLSESIIHVDVSTGSPIQKEIVRAAMAIRLNMLLTGVSAIRLETLDKLRQLLNKNLTPIVGRYGSVGASGDLAQNGRILSVLLQFPGVKVWDSNGKVVNASELLKKEDIQPIKLDPKEGLALVNGDNFSSASCLFVAYSVSRLLIINHLVNAIVVQVLKGSNRNFHPFLSKVRSHPGQELSAKLFRSFLKGSRLSLQELNGHKLKSDGELVQDPYSIRCLPQYYGPDWEALLSIWETLKININSVSDNPLWVTPDFTLRGEVPYQWVSGGNFMAMNMSESIDRLRKIMVHIIKLNDRHLARLVYPAFNHGLPANLSDHEAASQSTFKGMQTQMGMYDVYSSLLVSPASTAFGNHEEFNQDITSHAPSSSILAWELLKVTKYAIATNLIAACQAVDLRGGGKMLSPKTRPLYEWLRKFVPYIKREQPLGGYLEEVSRSLLEIDIARFTNFSFVI